MTLKIAVLAPIPSASVTTAIPVNIGRLSRTRAPYLMSSHRPLILSSRLQLTLQQLDQDSVQPQVKNHAIKINGKLTKTFFGLNTRDTRRIVLRSPKETNVAYINIERMILTFGTDHPNFGDGPNTVTSLCGELDLDLDVAHRRNCGTSCKAKASF